MKRSAIKRKPDPMVQFECERCGAEIERRESRVGEGLCRTCSSRQNGVKAAATRRTIRTGKDAACRQCGETFYTTRDDRKFCSQKCMGLWNRRPRQRFCAVCGESFERPARSRRKTCSETCRRAAIAADRSRPLAEAKRRWRASKEDRCHICRQRDDGSFGRRLVLHHVVYEQHVKRKGGDIYDIRNGLTLCSDCHSGHHNGLDRRLGVSQLRPENIVFAVELIGVAVVDYFPRYYDNDDPRRLHEAVEMQPLCPAEEGWWPGADMDPRP